MNHLTDTDPVFASIASGAPPKATLSFDAPKLALALEALSAEQLDCLTFGVIGLDKKGMVRVYNRTEAVQSGYKSRPSVGRTFFTDVAPCMDNPYFKGRIDSARQAGKLDIQFEFVGDFNDRDRTLTVRVQAASDGGLWICHKREQDAK